MFHPKDLTAKLRIAVIGVAVAIALLPTTGFAQSCTSSRLGSYSYASCSDGNYATTTRLGNSYYTDYSDGNYATTTRLGNSYYTDYSDGSYATTTRLGNSYYTDYWGR
jgi:hypothetical protein